MSTSKHTPGPWKWQGTRGNPKLYAYLSGPDGLVAACCGGLELKPADAALIAAAPEMLEALKLAVAAFSGVRANDAEAAGFDLAKAREIIARAEGKA